MKTYSCHKISEGCAEGEILLSKDDFYDRAKDFALFKDTDGKYFTYDEYKTLIKENQTDKDGQTVYLYANDKEGQYSYIEAAKAKGYSVLLLPPDPSFPEEALKSLLSYS